LVTTYFKKIALSLTLAAAAHGLLLTSSCARIGHPTGGLKDTVPPVLLKTQPEQGALFFNKKRVSITFNEYVQLKEADKQFIMSPPPERRPTLTIKGKSVVAAFNSPLKDSTTYQLNFGTSIVDNNEGNPYGEYRFAFSTGEALDSLRVEGLALDAYSDQPVEKLMAYLYEDMSDSVVLKVRPDNLTRTNEHGMFLAENLKNKPYKIVLLDDANKNYKYDVGQEAIGFLELPVLPLADTALHYHHREGDTLRIDHRDIKIALRTFTEEVQAQYLTSCEQVEKRALKMTFNAPFPTVDSLAIDSMDVSRFVVEASPRRDTVIYWFADTAARVPDTLKLSFVYLKTDTLGELSPSREKRRFIFVEKKKEEAGAPPKQSGIGGLLSRIAGTEEADSTPKKPAHWTLRPSLKTAGAGPIEHVSVAFAAPLVAADVRQLTFEERQINPRTKDTTFTRVKYALERDSIRLRSYRFAAEWKENTFYRYTVLPNAFTDIYAQTNDTVKGEFTTVDPEKLSTLVVDFSNVEGSYVVQITDPKGKNIVREQTLNASQKVEFKYVNPSTYGIRVIKDDNANGRWDTGSYFKRLQPEYATFLKTGDGKPEFAFRQGWDVELSVDVKVLFPEK
jgi:hypothetical protein